MKNRDIVRNLNGLAGLQQRNNALPIKVCYAVTKNIKILTEAYKPYEEELKKLDKRYDVEADNQNMSKKNEELKELLEIDNPDIVIHKIRIEDLAGCESITPVDMDALYFMIEE